MAKKRSNNEYTGVQKPKVETNPVFEYITTEATAYRTSGVQLADNWEWKMFEHIKRSFLYKHSKFADGENDGARPFRNIVRPILNVAYRSEGFDVKDITVFVDNDKDYDKSFFTKKFAHRWGINNGLDVFIDDMTEAFVDIGLTVVQRVSGKAPRSVPLQSIAFCDQTDFMAGSKCLLHSMTIDELNEMRGKWNDDAIDTAIEKMQQGKMILGSSDAEGKIVKTPGKYAQVYELHGTFPETWLNDSYSSSKANDDDDAEATEYTDEKKYAKQLHLVAYYYDDKNNECGIHFFKGVEKKETFKAKKRNPIFNRACGFGAIEELFDPQQWTNMSEIQQQEMLEVASIMLLQVAEGSGKTKNILTDLQKGEVLEHENGKPYSSLQFNVGNIGFFDKNVEKWNGAAQALGSANEAVQGKSPTAGTPFSLQALVVQQNFGYHDYQKGKLSDFMAEIYREWILDELVADMKSGGKWLASLDLDEMQALVENVVNLETWKMMKDHLANGLLPTEEQKQLYMQQVRDGFMKDSKKFLELIEDELNDIPASVEIDVAGQEFDLQDRATKLTNIFRQIMQNPQILQMPGMADLFNEIIESSGFSPIDFSGFTRAPAQAVANPAGEVPAAPAAAPAPVAQAQPAPVAA